MAINRGVSVDSQFLPNATGSLYTPPTGVTRGVITAVVMYGNLATTAIELYVVPNLGSPTTTNRTTLKNFAANETYTAPELIGQAILFGATLQGNDGGNGGTDVNIRLTITEFTGDS